MIILETASWPEAAVAIAFFAMIAVVLWAFFR